MFLLVTPAVRSAKKRQAIGRQQITPIADVFSSANYVANSMHKAVSVEILCNDTTTSTAISFTVTRWDGTTSMPRFDEITPV